MIEAALKTDCGS